MNTLETPQFVSHKFRVKTLEQRFWERVNKNGPIPSHCPELGPCWLWIGQLNKAGRPIMRRESGKDSAKTSAARIALELKEGRPIHDDLFALHHCDNETCIAFAHLYPGTRADNAADMMRRNRHKWSPAFIGQKGESAWNSRFKVADVIEMRRLHWVEKETYADIGRRFNLNSGRVYRICTGQQWASVKEGLPTKEQSTPSTLPPLTQILLCISVLSNLRNTLLRSVS